MDRRSAGWGNSWGASAAERAMPLACDRLLPDAPVRLHRAVSVSAPASIVFRWLCQLKLAPYSYDLIDNLGRTSPRELVAGTEHLEVGQRALALGDLVMMRKQLLTLKLLAGETARAPTP